MAGQYARLVHSDDLGKIVLGFEEAIAISFMTNPVRNVTQNEVRRRFQICDKVFSNLRGDLHWSVPKILSVLSTYLKCELDGVPYTPEDITTAWSPDAVENSHDVPRLENTKVIGDLAESASGAAEDSAFSELEEDLAT